MTSGVPGPVPTCSGERGQAGVSLIEAIVGLVISGMLISSMGGMLINMQRAYQSVSGSSAVNRSDVFTERQLRSLMMHVINEPEQKTSRQRFEGGRSQISGVVTGGLMGHELATRFTLEILDDDDETGGAAFSVELDETEYTVRLNGVNSPHFSFLDERGRVYDTWPQSNQNTSLISGATGRFARSPLPSAVIVESDQDDLEAGPGRTLVLRVAGARIYPGDQKKN